MVSVSENIDTFVLHRWLFALVLVILVVVICYYWLDRPIALFVYNHFPRISPVLVEPVTTVPNPIISAAAVTFLAFGIRGLAGRPLSKLQEAIFVCSVSLMVGEAIKNQLKFVFGRTWPETWHQNRPSFIHDGIYGFNLFHGGEAYQSFPSGHMTAICALASVLWIYYPRMRRIYLIVALLAFAGLVGGNFHFISDIIAGAFVGASTGLMATMLFNQRRALGPTVLARSITCDQK
jgi:membrane-associated phospholipid phosphatase